MSIRRGNHVIARVYAPERRVVLTARIHRWNDDTHDCILHADDLPAPGAYLSATYDFAAIPPGTPVRITHQPERRFRGTEVVFTGEITKGYGPRLSITNLEVAE